MAGQQIIQDGEVFAEINRRLQKLQADSTSCDDGVLHLCRETLEMAGKAGAREQCLDLYCILTRVLSRRGDFEESIATCRRILPELRESGVGHRIMSVLNSLSVALCNESRYAESIEAAQEALQIADELGRKDAAGHISGNIGLSFSYMGDMDQALAFYQQSFEFWKDLEEPIGMGNALINIGIAHSQFGDQKSAKESIIRADEHYRKAGFIEGISAVKRSLAVVAMNEAEHDHALALVESALSHDTGSRFKTLQCLEAKAQILAKMERYEHALEVGRSVLAGWEEMRVDLGRLGALMALAEIPHEDPLVTLDFLQQGLELAVARGTKPEQATFHRGFATQFKRMERFREAFEHLERADALEREILSAKAEQRIRALKLMHEVASERAAAELERRRNQELQNVLNDVDEQRRIAEEESRQKTQLLSFAAHDLRNLTGGIFSGLKLLGDMAEDLADGSEIKELAGHLCESASELHQTMTTVMDAGALEAGEARPQFEEIDLKGLLNAQIARLQTYAANKSQTLKVDMQTDRIAVADLTQIRSVFNNLIDNAIKYSPTDSTILVTLNDDGEDVLLTVEDSGQGLEEGDLEKLGRPFQRLTPQPTGGEISVGLGLYVVRKQLALHGGRLEYCRRAEGGSRFVARFPAGNRNG